MTLNPGMEGGFSVRSCPVKTVSGHYAQEYERFGCNECGLLDNR